MSKSISELRDLLNQRTNEATAELEKIGKLSARQRMDVIFDEGTFVEIGAFVGSGDADSTDGYGAVITGYGSIDGYLVFAFAQDYSRLHGAMTAEQTAKIANIIQMAADKGTPLIGVFDSAGTKIDDGLTSLDNLGIAISTLSACKFDEPTIAVISGPCGGSAAVFASMFDYKIIAKKTGSLYMTPKNILENKSLTDAEELLGNGFVDIVSASLGSHISAEIPVKLVLRLCLVEVIELGLESINLCHHLIKFLLGILIFTIQDLILIILVKVNSP